MKTLQARREWHDIFKVMKGKSLQTRISTQQDSHSDLMEKSKAFPTSKFKRIQQHQTNFTTNAERTSKAESTGQGKDLQKISPEQLRKW